MTGYSLRSRFQKIVVLRVKKVLKDLYKKIWLEDRDLEVMGGPLNDVFLSLEKAKQQPMRRVEKGELFGGPGNTWKQRWFKVKINGAGVNERGNRVLFWNSGGETTVYHRGIPWAGIDVAHRYCVVPDDECELWMDTGVYETGIMADANEKRIDEFGCRFDGAQLCLRNQDCWDFYWDVRCLADLMNLLVKKHLREGSDDDGKYMEDPVEVPVVLRYLLEKLDRVCDSLETGSATHGRELVDEMYSRLKTTPWQGEAALCGHCHIDPVWLWPEKVGVRKSVHSIATAVRLLERYPELLFTQSQAALYRAVENVEPELIRQVRSLIDKGKWEATGGMEVESDVNLPCGEGLVRTIVLGQEKFASLRGGENCRTLWLPDVFGFSNCLPQIMNLAGLDSFFTTKLNWSALNRFPHSAFWWRGPDGSKVLSFLCPTTYTGTVDPENLVKSVEKQRQTGIFPKTLLPQGFGDGGGGPTEAMCERARRFSDLACIPKTSWTKVEDFFKELRSFADHLPTYEGELYLEYHRGVHTSQAALKYNYRRAERALQAREGADAILGHGPSTDSSWERVCFAQFHDALPGSSCTEVYEELGPEMKNIADTQFAKAAEQLEQSRGILPNGGVSFFNPLLLPVTRPINVNLNNEKEILCWAPAGPMETVEPFEQGRKSIPDIPWSVSQGSLDNGLTRASFDDRGRLCSLNVYGKELQFSEPADLVLYPDHPADWDAWDIDRHTLELGVRLGGCGALRIIEQGPVRAVLEGRVKIGDASSATVRFALEAGNPDLMIEMDVNWNESHRLLKYHVFTRYMGRSARYGCPFGSVLRPQKPGSDIDDAMWEVPGSRWAAVFDEGERDGLALITEAKYGFSCRDGNLGLSLLRSPTYPDPHADRGRHMIRFAVGRHFTLTAGGRVSTPARAETLFGPRVISRAKPAPSPLWLDKIGSLVPSWIAPSQKDEGVIIRVHETAGRRGTALLNLMKKPSEVSLVDFLERPIGTLRTKDADTYAIDYSPYRILNIKILG